MYSQGQTLLTATTRRWTLDQWDANEERERRTVYRNFSMQDQGRSRVLVQECQSAEEAASMVDDLNGNPLGTKGAG